jgi:peptidoglycan/xylan/chitin deacetylase (PgdA/CDA1 family)
VRETYACLTVHAERLERDPVWDAVRRALDRIEPHGVHVTFFVHPFGAIRAEIDIADRIKELAERGHEIAQHTHFYAEYDETEAGVRKRTDLAPTVIESSLARDRDYLLEAGFTPRGFVSGGWAIHTAIFEWLEAHGYSYDCSYRTYRLPYESGHSRDGYDVDGPFRMGSLLEVPTSSSLKDEVMAAPWAGSGAVAVGDVKYRLSYLHDDDLLERRKFLSLTRLRGLRLGGRVRHVTADALAGVLGSRLQGRSPGVL